MDNDQLKRRAGSSSSAGSGQGKIAESSSSGTRGYGQGGRRRDEGRYQTDRTTVTAGRVRPQSNLLLRKWRSARGHRVVLGHTGRDTEAGEEVLRRRRRIGILREALVAPLEDDDGEVESRTATTTRSLVATPTTERPRSSTPPQSCDRSTTSIPRRWSAIPCTPLPYLRVFGQAHGNVSVQREKIDG